MVETHSFLSLQLPAGVQDLCFSTALKRSVALTGDRLAEVSPTGGERHDNRENEGR